MSTSCKSAPLSSRLQIPHIMLSQNSNQIVYIIGYDTRRCSSPLDAARFTTLSQHRYRREGNVVVRKQKGRLSRLKPSPQHHCSRIDGKVFPRVEFSQGAAANRVVDSLGYVSNSHNRRAWHCNFFLSFIRPTSTSPHTQISCIGSARERRIQ